MGIHVMSKFQNPFVYGRFEKVGNFSILVMGAGTWVWGACFHSPPEFSRDIILGGNLFSVIE